MVKGSAAGNLLADSIRKALDWGKEWMLGAAQHAAHTDKMSMTTLATALVVSAEASNRAVEAVKKVGFGTQDAIHAVDRLIVADMNLSKAEGLAEVPVRGGASPRVEPSLCPASERLPVWMLRCRYLAICKKCAGSIHASYANSAVAFRPTGWRLSS
jgi:hypothetical protein